MITLINKKKTEHEFLNHLDNEINFLAKWYSEKPGFDDFKKFVKKSMDDSDFFKDNFITDKEITNLYMNIERIVRYKV
jgi:hypothetical protein